MRHQVAYQALLIGPADSPVLSAYLAELRQAIRQRNKVELVYQNQQGVLSTRIIWPVALGYFDHIRMLAAWCELRQQLRHFRTDRIQQLNVLQEHYPRQHHELLHEWKKNQGIGLKEDY